MFDKPLSAVTAADIDQVTKDEVHESDVVEFKEALSTKDGRDDAWYASADKIGDRARDSIIHEVLGFANAHGGTLLLGIKESDNHPKRAVGIRAIPRCADLAARLPHYFRDLVEPPLAPHPIVVPVETDGRGGVILVGVSPSRNAPHRHKATLQSYMRRGEHTQPMTMRDIQDLTLQVERGLNLLERQFSDSAARFKMLCRPSTAMAVRATALPLSRVSVPIPHNADVIPPVGRFSGLVGDRKVSLVLPHAPETFRPILRGLRAHNEDDAAEVVIEVRETGVLEIFFNRREGDGQRNVIYLGWLLGAACNALAIADYLRIAAGAPGTEYGLELAVYDGGSLAVAAFGGQEYGVRRWLAGSTTFPRYQVGDRAGFSDVVQLIERDFWNGAGIRHLDPPVRVAFG